MGSELYILYGGVQWFATGYNLPSTNQWYHIALVRANGTASIYVNGIQRGNTSTLVPKTPASFRIGSQEGIRHFSGLIDEVRIWNTARTQAQIQTNMNVELSSETGLVANYHFNQGIAGENNTSITTLIDVSGNNKIGTLNNFTLTGSTSNWVSSNALGLTVTNNVPPVYPIGNTIVTWTATDNAGNAASCNQTVTVRDNQAPTVICQPITVNLDNSGMTTITASQVNNGSTDNVGIASMTLSKSTFTCADLSNGALNFTTGADGVTSNTNFTGATGTSARTISAWVKPTASNDTYAVAHMGDQDLGAAMFGIGIQLGNRVSFWGGYNDYVSDLTVPLNTWSYIALTYDGNNTYTLFVDGQSRTFYLTASNTLLSKFFVGHETTDNGLTYRRQFIGAVDEVKVYNRALNAAEIALDRQGTLQTNLVLYYPFNEGSGTTINDASGNNNQATLLNPTGTNWINRILNTVTTTLTVTDNSGNSASCVAMVTVMDTNNYCTVAGTTVISSMNMVPLVDFITPIQQSKVYPNPSQDKIVVESKHAIESTKQIVLVDLVGRISPQSNTRLLNKNRIEMEIAHLPKGVHFIKIMSKNGIEILTFIKL